MRKGPDEGCYFYGLYLEGSRWDKSGNKLADSEPKVLFAPLPVLHFTGNLEDKDKAASGTPQYNCPCYKNPKRTGLNFIFEVNLRSEEHASKWVLRGVCLLTSTDA